MRQVLLLLLVLEVLRQVVDERQRRREDERLSVLLLLLVRVDHFQKVLQLLEVAFLHHPVGFVDGEKPVGEKEELVCQKSTGVSFREQKFSAYLFLHNEILRD